MECVTVAVEVAPTASLLTWYFLQTGNISTRVSTLSTLCILQSMQGTACWHAAQNVLSMAMRSLWHAGHVFSNRAHAGRSLVSRRGQRCVCRLQ
jgi:hypothetical protein